MTPPRRGAGALSGDRRPSSVCPSVCLSVCLMSRISALTRKPKGLGRRNFAQGYPRSHATPTPTSRSKGQKSRSAGAGAYCGGHLAAQLVGVATHGVEFRDATGQLSELLYSLKLQASQSCVTRTLPLLSARGLLVLPVHDAVYCPYLGVDRTSAMPLHTCFTLFYQRRCSSSHDVCLLGEK